MKKYSYEKYIDIVHNYNYTNFEIQTGMFEQLECRGVYNEQYLKSNVYSVKEFIKIMFNFYAIQLNEQKYISKTEQKIIDKYLK